MRNLREICFFCLLLVTLFACRKEVDSISPRIKVSEPLQGSVYNVYDTLWIHALITDDSRLVSVKISLLDAFKKPVLRTLDFIPDSAIFNINTGLPLDDIHLADGIYTLQVKAFDGINYTNAFTEIRINELAREMIYPVLISLDGIYGINVSIAETNGSWRKVLSLSGDYSVSDISSFDQQVYTAGSLTGGLNACLLPSGQVVWQEPLVSEPPYRYFEDVYFARPFLYVAYYEGKVAGFDNSGMVKYSSQIEPGYIPEKIGYCGDYVFAGQRQKTGVVRKIGVYYSVSGSLKQSLVVPLDVMAFFEQNKDKVLVFGNNGILGSIMEYTISQNKLELLQTFPDGRIGAVSRMNDSNFFISGEGAVYWYRYQENKLVEYIPDAPKALLGFDVVNDRLYALFNHELTAYNFPYASPLAIIHVADSALAFHLMYNK